MHTGATLRTERRGVWSRLRTMLHKNSTTRSEKHVSAHALMQAFMYTPGKPVWMARDYTRFADEAYIRNVIAFRSINLIAEGGASVPLRLHRLLESGQQELVTQHPVLSLLADPNPSAHGTLLIENILAYRLISGNAYILAVGPAGEPPKELHVLRPDRVAVIAGKNGMPAGYRYQLGDTHTDYPVDPITGLSRILHIKSFHPLDDWYGLSAVEAAAYSIDQHNQAGNWNQSLLQNGARPSGALVVNTQQNGGSGTLSEEQYWRIKQQMDEHFSGPANAGRPLLLEGGLDWREMSLSPRDMDFISTKHSSARDIALAFGVPPQLLGIPGDNTYANLAEARLALWEQTILPLMQSLSDALNGWLLPMYEPGLQLSCHTDTISALALRREKVWERAQNASFLTINEKRAAVGYGPVEGGDVLSSPR